jgi:hypothetical protein
LARIGAANCSPRELGIVPRPPILARAFSIVNIHLIQKTGAKPKVDEKAYNSALSGSPDRKFDPGGREQAVATNKASSLPDSLRLAPGRGSSLRAASSSLPLPATDRNGNLEFFVTSPTLTVRFHTLSLRRLPNARVAERRVSDGGRILRWTWAPRPVRSSPPSYSVAKPLIARLVLPVILHLARVARKP